MGRGKLYKSFIFGCSILFLLILSAPDVNTNISNSNTEFLDCDSKSYAEVDFLRVNNIQTFLKNENFFDGKVSGYFDENLLSALKKFQQFVGIRIDGIMGPSTHKAMTSYDKCEKKVRASMINCGDYLAYRECTFFVNAFDTMQKDKDIETPLPSIPIEKNVINKKDIRINSEFFVKLIRPIILNKTNKNIQNTMIKKLIGNM